MKKLIALLFLGVLALTGCQSTFRPQTATWSQDGVKVTAELKKLDAAPELGAALLLTITNGSKAEISIRQTRPLDQFKILIHDADNMNKEVPLTMEWRDIILTPIQRHNYQVIAPGESFTYEPAILRNMFMVKLENNYKMKIAGTYYIKEAKKEEIYLLDRIKWYNR